MRTRLTLACLLTSISISASANIPLQCEQVDKPPTIDGDPNDDAWVHAQSVTVPDVVAEIKHSVFCVHTDDRIYLLVSFPDETENRKHKTLVWDEDESRYKIGPRREDTVVLKWNMEPKAVDLSLSSNMPYKADIWYWKAYRTDHQGYADDKLHIYTNEPLRKSKKLLSKTGQRFYLKRSGDDGDAAYQTKIYTDNLGKEVSGYELTEPTGSRADVAAKGVWKDGNWNIEFSRQLKTDNPDDVQLNTERSYTFGVSRYEIAGAKPNEELETPNFGSGELGPLIKLIFGNDKVATW